MDGGREALVGLDGRSEGGGILNAVLVYRGGG